MAEVVRLENFTRTPERENRFAATQSGAIRFVVKMLSWERTEIVVSHASGAEDRWGRFPGQMELQAI